jgi:hypothetical protein
MHIRSLLMITMHIHERKKVVSELTIDLSEVYSAMPRVAIALFFFSGNFTVPTYL